MATHVRKVCDFFLARHLRVYSGFSGFLSLKEKEVPWNTEKICSVVFPQPPNLAIAAVSPASRWERAWPSTTNPCIYTAAL